jgi:hypothetical protein
MKPVNPHSHSTRELASRASLVVGPSLVIWPGKPLALAMHYQAIWTLRHMDILTRRTP